MSRRSNQKLKLLYLSKILLDMTDERHGLTLTEILNELSKYGIETGRKSLYDDMEALRVYGLDVCTKRDRYVRYYIKDRTLSRADVKLISDLLISSPVINNARSVELIKKIWNNEYMSGIALGERCGDLVDFSDDVYKNLEILCKAMTENKAVSFKYFEWNSHKQRILSREGQRITASPWRLEMNDGKYRLLCFDHDKKAPAIFLPEKMLSLAISDKSRRGECGTLEESSCIEPTNVRLTCSNSVAPYVFDRFGSNVTVLSNREDEFDVSLKTVIDDSFFSWLFLGEGKVRILSPEWVVEKYASLVSQCNPNNKT